MDALLKGITLGLLLTISVGPIVFTVIKQSITNGYKGGLAFIAGISLSDILLVIFSNLFTNLFDVLNAHKRILAVIASIFLILAGIYYLFFKKSKDMVQVGSEDEAMETHDYIKLFITGFIMNIFNPGIIVFWLTTATTFSNNTINHRIVIFATALLLAFAADVAKVLLASKIRERMTAKNIHRVNQINGFILIAFGVFIIFFEK
jgi:threonine/homoserine/homoserine lactone efflux protein